MSKPTHVLGAIDVLMDSRKLLPLAADYTVQRMLDEVICYTASLLSCVATELERAENYPQRLIDALKTKIAALEKQP